MININNTDYVNYPKIDSRKRLCCRAKRDRDINSRVGWATIRISALVRSEIKRNVILDTKKILD
jgi:hypothetical protein